LEDAIQIGNIEKALFEAAKIHLVAENSYSILECIAELGLQDVDNNGLFVYHLLRSAAFQLSEEQQWIFICSGLQTIMNGSLPDPHEYSALNSDYNVNKFLMHDNPSSLIIFSAVCRLLDEEYLRKRGFEREINAWFNTLEFSQELKIDETEKCVWVWDYFHNNGDEIILVAEELIKDSKINGEALHGKLVGLESLRHIVKNINIEDQKLMDQYIKRLGIL
jgi:hypothetical protein